ISGISTRRTQTICSAHPNEFLSKSSACKQNYVQLLWYNRAFLTFRPDGMSVQTVTYNKFWGCPR
ncbi:hypothetical protein, partial [Neisseria meningitidis]|uniref:hypothetical protein n=1 Tax=Neisseria meningitidis TaxID=487 RepID=UPI001E3EAB29